MSFRVLFAGGGTGGHLFPGIAVAEELEQRDTGIDILFAGSNRLIEKQIIGRTGYAHRALDTEPSTSLTRHPFRFLSRFREACRLAASELSHFDADVIVGLGGFASLPFVLAARRQKRRIVLLEQNSIAGRATRLGSYWADELCLSFPETQGRLSHRPKRIIAGNPVRSSVLNATSAEPSPSSGMRRKLIILGGSQGARSVNVEIVVALRSLSDALGDWEIIHQTGVEDARLIAELYQQSNLNVHSAPFFEQMETLYAGATLAICRAGATTLAELACVGCPAILYPFPHAIHDHQTANARFYERGGGAVVMRDRQLNFSETAAIARQENLLGQKLHQLLRQPDQLTAMRQAMFRLAQPNAARNVADIILQ